MKKEENRIVGENERNIRKERRIEKKQMEGMEW